MAKKGHIPWNKGKTGVQPAWNKGLTKETDTRIKKYSEKHKGKKLSDEHKKKISQSKLGIKLKPLSEEHKKKISESNKGKKRKPKTTEEKQHLSRMLKGRISPTIYTYKTLIKKNPQILNDHEIRSYHDYVEVRCINCKSWFIPSRQDISEKIRQIKTGTGLKYLFCSQKCKDESYLYRMKKDPVMLSQYEKYCRTVEIETRKSISMYSNKIRNYHLRSYEYHLDHIYSMLDGFTNNISPKIIGHWRNLQILSKFENESKGGNSDIRISELEEKIKYDKNISNS